MSFFQPSTPIGGAGLPADIEQLRQLAADVAARVLAPQAAAVDRDAAWPAAGMAALAQCGLTGLHVARRLGGHEQGLLALAAVTEALGNACGSTGMCFGMHCVASSVLGANATADQEVRFLRPIAAGRHITSLALSEPGTGAHLFLPRVHFAAEGEHYTLHGEKSFVTSGGHADSYVVSVVAPGAELDAGTFTCLMVEADAPGLAWGPAWNGLGMRGNSSRAAQLDGVTVPRDNLLGAVGDQIWYVFEVVAPYFLVAMSGVYLGIAQAALDATIAHLKSRRHSHTGDALSDIAVLWHEVAQMWTELEASRCLLHHAARRGDAGDADAAPGLFAAKIRVAQTCTAVTAAAMTLGGGRSYTQDNLIARLLRDARAADVMSPTTHILKNWLGRSLLGLPLL